MADVIPQHVDMTRGDIARLSPQPPGEAVHTVQNALLRDGLYAVVVRRLMGAASNT